MPTIERVLDFNSVNSEYDETDSRKGKLTNEYIFRFFTYLAELNGMAYGQVDQEYYSDHSGGVETL